MKIFLPILIYITAVITLVSLFFFIGWAATMPGLLISGFESMGLPPLSDAYPWRIIISMQLTGGVLGWASLLVLFLKRNKELKEISKLWLGGLAAGLLTAITLIGGFHPLSYPPISLAALLLLQMIKNKPNKALNSDVNIPH